MSAYRMTTHSVTGATPNLAMLGREVLIPATLIAQPPDEPSKPVTPYVTTFRSTIRDVHHRIRLNTGAVAKTQKNYFDKFVRGSPFHVDQLVWLYCGGLDLHFVNKDESFNVFGQDLGE